MRSRSPDTSHAPRSRWMWAIVGLLLASGVEASEPVTASATLPLETILEMQKRLDGANKKADREPPVAAVVNRVEVVGRLLEDAAEFEVHFDLQVLAGDVWVDLPLLKQDARTHVLKLPDVAEGAFAVVDGMLRFVTKTPKRYQFDLTVLQEAAVEKDRRAARLEMANASMSTCRLTFDDNLFALLNERVLARPDGVLVFPTRDAFQIEWAVRQGAMVRDAVAKPEIAPVIPVARASSVSTLEGIRITRLRYELRFAGRKPIAFVIPPHHQVERAYLNGFAVPVEVAEGRLSMEAAPARAGDEFATVELVLVADEGVFHLAGTVGVTLPQASWPVNELFLDLHLPEVFTYEWAGGSLSAVESNAMPEFTYRVPRPGKRMSFHQYLVTTQAPHLQLDYAVDLEDQYFCVRNAEATRTEATSQPPTGR